MTEIITETTANANQTTTAAEQKQVNEFLRCGLRLTVSTVLHPLEYAKVLIQLGYEPLPPKLGTNLLGNPVYILPNLFQYAGHIKSIDGINGCYRGLIPKLMGNIMGLLCSGSVAEYIGLNVPEATAKEILNDEELHIQFLACLKRDILLTTTSVVISQPFHVISVRMMAQFIGREEIYDTLLSSVVEIFNTEGLSGFFCGLVPKLVSDLTCLVLTSTTVYMLNKYLIKDKMGRAYNAGLTQYVFSSILYPFQVISTCMTVSGSRLLAGQPPITPLYGSWLECWHDLQIRGELKRGSSPLFRTIPIPTSTVHNTPNKYSFPFVVKHK